jgi:outer membrane protein OmpU
MNIKKVGLTALAGSLVATSAFAGEMSVAGSASIGIEHTNGGHGIAGKTFSMGNQLTFSGSGELDNGLNVSLSFILDQGDDTAIATAPFDSHSVTVSSDSFGSLKFSGEGGSSSTSALDTTAAGDLWDNYDDETGLEPTGVGTGDNMMMYTLPSLMDDLSVNVSYKPKSAAATDSAVGYGATYSGVEGLSVSFATGDDTSVGNTGDGTVMKASYAIGSATIAYSNYEYDTTGTSSDDDVTAYKLTYTVSDELSVSYASEEVETGTLSAEYEQVSASYTAGGMTLTASMGDATDIDGTTTDTEDRERWAIGASFAF